MQRRHGPPPLRSERRNYSLSRDIKLRASINNIQARNTTAPPVGPCQFGLVTFVLVLLVVTTIYEALATANERARFPAPGRMVDVGGYRLHLRCTGQGSPTVVLESGGGMSSMSGLWSNLK